MLRSERIRQTYLDTNPIVTWLTIAQLDDTKLVTRIHRTSNLVQEVFAILNSTQEALNTGSNDWWWWWSSTLSRC